MYSVRSLHVHALTFQHCLVMLARKPRQRTVPPWFVLRCVWASLVLSAQSPLPFAVASRIPLAITQGLAYHAAGASVPFLRSFTAQCVGILLCALVRTYQVRAYHRWRVAAAQAKQAVAQAAPSGAAGSASASKKAL